MISFYYLSGLSRLLVAAVLGLSIRFSSVSAPETQTFCYRGIRTQNVLHPNAECFTVANGTFASVFNITNTPKSIGQVPIPSHPGYAVPGFWDGHGHLLHYGEVLLSVDLFGSWSIREVCRRVRSFLDKEPCAGTKTNWIRGMGWDEQNLDASPTSVSTHCLEI